jgi:CheY-like chemotaxis protein
MRSEALPLAEAASQPARALRSGNMKAQRPHLPGLKVLVIDDEADARDLVRRMLSECDMEVVTAGSATEAIDLGTADRPDVIVSDISMPDMDGYELILHMRTLGWTQPAIALTAFAREEDRHRALDAGYQLHIAKPVDAMELIKAVARLCGKVVG